MTVSVLKPDYDPSQYHPDHKEDPKKRDQVYNRGGGSCQVVNPGPSRDGGSHKVNDCRCQGEPHDEDQKQSYDPAHVSLFRGSQRNPLSPEPCHNRGEAYPYNEDHPE